MEHRWGVRIRLDLGVTLFGVAHIVARARLRDVSASGGFVVTTLPLQEMDRIGLRWSASDAQRPAGFVEGRVVRRCAGGVGIEWCEFAPADVVAIMQALGDPTSKPSAAGDRPARLETNNSELHGTGRRAFPLSQGEPGVM